MAFQFPAAPTVGQVFTPSAGINYKWNGSNWEPFKYGGDLGAAAVFTANGNFQSVLGAKYKITVVGGGGNGGSVSAPPDAVKAGGGGGGTAIKWWTGDGSLVAVTVGAGGNPSGVSSFGALASATGGVTPGDFAVDSSGGAGGIGTVGDLLIAGNAGGSMSSSTNTAGGGTGGGSTLGGGGKAGNKITPSVGGNGGVYGGGGGGGATDLASGTGAPGVVIVETVG
jgi:hypothetical protein